MAFQNFWFPSQTTGYETHSGSVRINIHYNTGAGASNTDIDCRLLKLSPLDMPFEVSPSEGTFRFPSIDFTFNNPIYDATNNIFEQYSILNETYKNELLVDFYIDGSVFWQGIIDFSKIARSEYYLDGANLKYRKIKLKIYDRLAYFWFNAEKDLDDASYADDDLITTVITNTLALINISSGDIVYDAGKWGIDEACGNSYDSDDYKCDQFAGTELLKDFLKDFMLGFASWIYSWNGKYYVVARNGGTTKSIVSPFILSVKKIENANPIEYVKASADIIWSNKCPILSASVVDWDTSREHSKTYGVSTVDSAKQFLAHSEDFMDKIYIELASSPGTNYPAPLTENPTNGTQITLEDNAQTSDFFTEEIETGMVVSYNTEGAHAPITVVDDDENITFPTTGITVNTGLYYYIRREPGGPGDTTFIIKVQMLLEMAAAIYNDFFLTSPDVINVRLSDISEFVNIHYRFVIFGNNHRIKSGKFYFDKDEMILDLVQVI